MDQDTARNGSSPIANLADAQRRIERLEAELAACRSPAAEPIAILGMACRFPGGADSPAAFWRMLQCGVDAVSEVPANRWDADALYDPDPAAPGKMNTRWGGFLRNVELFDNQFFGISAREALRMDPQQRMLLEMAWEALEDGGQVPERLRGSSAGVFVGISNSEHGIGLLTDLGQADAYVPTGNAAAVAANRISFGFDFRGPSTAIDAACSSSLVAVHLACQSLRSGESCLALAGAVNLVLLPSQSVNLTKAGFSSSSGRCRSFDASANGYVRGEGGGLVLLKPLRAALADGDPIRAIVRSCAVNHGGGTLSLTAPSSASQEAMLRAAYAQAGVTPGDIDYVEAQGTGTSLGDAIEANVLGRVLAEGRAANRPCAVGCVKTNIGHLEAAAGIAALVKTVLALEHRQLPPTLHFRTPNPDIPFDRLPIRVQQSLGPWPAAARPALAGVSALGFGGTNAHLVLEEAPRAATISDGADELERPIVIPLSARTPQALRQLAAAWREYLDDDPAPLADIGYTAALRREHHAVRLALVVRSYDEAADLLTAFLNDKPRRGCWRGGPADLEPPADLLSAIAAAYAAGQAVDWQSVYPARGRCARLPSYPWQRQRFWIEVARPRMVDESAPTPSPSAAPALKQVHARNELNQPYVPPATELEQQLACLWAETLGWDRVGIRDNYMALGGDSVQALGLINRLQEHLAESVPPVALLETQTIAELAAYLRRRYPAAVKRLFPFEPVGDPADDMPPELPALAPAAREILDLDRLSDDEVDRLLERTLAERETSHE